MSEDAKEVHAPKFDATLEPLQRGYHSTDIEHAIKVGNADHNDIIIPDPKADPKICHIWTRDKTAYYITNYSRKGLYVNDTLVKNRGECHKLENNDTIYFVRSSEIKEDEWVKFKVKLVELPPTPKPEPKPTEPSQSSGHDKNFYGYDPDYSDENSYEAYQREKSEKKWKEYHRHKVGAIQRLWSETEFEDDNSPTRIKSDDSEKEEEKKHPEDSKSEDSKSHNSEDSKQENSEKSNSDSESSQSSENTEQPECPVCLKRLKKAVCLVPCLHKVCRHCSKKLFEAGNMCPVCLVDIISMNSLKEEDEKLTKLKKKNLRENEDSKENSENSSQSNNDSQENSNSSSGSENSAESGSSGSENSSQSSENYKKSNGSSDSEDSSSSENSHESSRNSEESSENSSKSSENSSQSSENSSKFSENSSDSSKNSDNSSSKSGSSSSENSSGKSYENSSQNSEPSSTQKFKSKLIKKNSDDNPPKKENQHEESKIINEDSKELPKKPEESKIDIFNQKYVQKERPAYEPTQGSCVGCGETQNLKTAVNYSYSFIGTGPGQYPLLKAQEIEAICKRAELEIGEMWEEMKDYCFNSEQFDLPLGKITLKKGVKYCGNCMNDIWFQILDIFREGWADYNNY